MTTAVDLAEARMKKEMTAQEAFEDALLRYECDGGCAWDTPVRVFELALPAMSAKRRRQILIMLQGRLATYTPELIANAEEKIRLLQAAELLLPAHDDET
jgi:hypothetical protein